VKEDEVKTIKIYEYESETEESIERMKEVFTTHDWTLSISIKSWRGFPVYNASATVREKYYISLDAESLREAIDDVIKQARCEGVF
jgi:hypothetical protein